MVKACWWAGKMNFNFDHLSKTMQILQESTNPWIFSILLFQSLLWNFIHMCSIST